MIKKYSKGISIDLSFWRLVFEIKISKSLTWGKGNESYFFHLGSFTDGENTACKIVILPLLIFIGWIK